MTNNIGKLVSISFFVGDRPYTAKVSPYRPMAIIISDENVIAYTVLRPLPDSSTKKNRYAHVVDPSDAEEVKADRKLTRNQSRTIYDKTGNLNALRQIAHPAGETFRCDCPLVFATPVKP